MKTKIFKSIFRTLEQTVVKIKQNQSKLFFLGPQKFRLCSDFAKTLLFNIRFQFLTKFYTFIYIPIIFLIPWKEKKYFQVNIRNSRANFSKNEAKSEQTFFFWDLGNFDFALTLLQLY